MHYNQTVKGQSQSKNTENRKKKGLITYKNKCISRFLIINLKRTEGSELVHSRCRKKKLPTENSVTGKILLEK
jgi:hypothetical protein